MVTACNIMLSTNVAWCDMVIACHFAAHNSGVLTGFASRQAPTLCVTSFKLLTE